MLFPLAFSIKSWLGRRHDIRYKLDYPGPMTPHLKEAGKVGLNINTTKIKVLNLMCHWTLPIYINEHNTGNYTDNATEINSVRCINRASTPSQFGPKSQLVHRTPLFCIIIPSLLMCCTRRANTTIIIKLQDLSLDCVVLSEFSSPIELSKKRTSSAHRPVTRKCYGGSGSQ